MALKGHVSVGKPTLGRALARDLGATFVDSADLRDASRRWVDEVLSAADRLVRAGIETLAGCAILVVAMPLRARLGVPAQGFVPKGRPRSAPPWRRTRTPSWLRAAVARSAAQSGAASPK